MDSMDQIYQKYAGYVYRYLMSLCRDEDLAEELTQETFYQAVRSIDRYDESSKITTWLCAIAKNQYLSYLRKHPPMESLESEDLSGAAAPSAESEALSRLGQADILKAIHRCPEPLREILYLRVFANLSFREIGDIVGMSETKARVTFFRGKERLRKELENGNS